MAIRRLDEAATPGEVGGGLLALPLRLAPTGMYRSLSWGARGKEYGAAQDYREGESW